MASNPTLSQIKVGNVVYDICDITARKKLNFNYINGETSITGTTLNVDYYSDPIEEIPSGITLITAQINAPKVATSDAVRNFYYGGQYRHSNENSWSNSATYLMTFSVEGSYNVPYIALFQDSQPRLFRFYRKTNKTGSTATTSVKYNVLTF